MWICRASKVSVKVRKPERSAVHDRTAYRAPIYATVHGKPTQIDALSRKYDV